MTDDRTARDLAPIDSPFSGDLTTASSANARHLPPSLQILLDDGLYNRMKQLAGIMAKSEGFTPRHLIGKPEACFTVIGMALDWRMNPSFVAKNTYQTPGGAIGFMGVLIQGALENSGKFIGAPQFEFVGDWERLAGKFDKSGNRVTPTWTTQDATGLGVIVRWRVCNEDVPRTWPGERTPFWLTQCYPLNSPLWATDPKTQIAYLAIRRFANQVAPGILGAAAFDADELLAASERARDVTPPTPEPQRGNAGLRAAMGRREETRELLSGGPTPEEKAAVLARERAGPPTPRLMGEVAEGEALRRGPRPEPPAQEVNPITGHPRPAQPAEEKGVPHELSAATESADGPSTTPAGTLDRQSVDQGVRSTGVLMGSDGRMVDIETGEVIGEAADAPATAPAALPVTSLNARFLAGEEPASLPAERDPFWSQSRLNIAPLPGRGKGMDWPATAQRLLALIADASSGAEVRSLEQDSHTTIQKLWLFDKEMKTDLRKRVIDAITARLVEFDPPPATDEERADG